MTSPPYVLVLDLSHEDLQHLHSSLDHLPCPVVMAASVEQAIAQAKELPPHLVILMGENLSRSPSVVHQLRQADHTASMTIVALTDMAHPYWDHLEAHPGLDGFLVKPVSGDVLSLLLESASAKQSW